MSNAILGSDRVEELLRLTLETLIAKDGAAHVGEVLKTVAARANLTAAELQLNDSGVPRWETRLRFYTSGCGRAGFMQKGKGYWKITELGREVVKLPKGQLMKDLNRRYRAWSSSRELGDGVGAEPATEEPSVATMKQEAFDKAEELARAGIESHIHKMPPYDFQELVGQLLKAMGYYVAHIAPPGPDGGIDLLVYKDPLGTVTPRVKVQVKHRRESKVSVKEIRELHGLLDNDEVGLMGYRAGDLPLMPRLRLGRRRSM